MSQPPLCVFCRRHAVEDAWRPFCSERCKLQDLAHWADGTYRIAAEPVEDAAAADDDAGNLKSDL
jgi:endogenous inhibitor of DNA gyrase (YacG/DUF329 family)